jgi:hypothetical protein
VSGLDLTCGARDVVAQGDVVAQEDVVAQGDVVLIKM